MLSWQHMAAGQSQAQSLEHALSQAVLDDVQASQQLYLDCSNGRVLVHLIQILLHAGRLHWHDILVCGPQLKGLQGSREPAAQVSLLHVASGALAFK